MNGWAAQHIIPAPAGRSEFVLALHEPVSV